jgi:hypothetical protein
MQAARERANKGWAGLSSFVGNTITSVANNVTNIVEGHGAAGSSSSAYNDSPLFERPSDYKGSSFEGFKGFGEDENTSSSTSVARNADGSTTVNGITLKPKTGKKYESLGSDSFGSTTDNNVDTADDDFGGWGSAAASSATTKQTQPVKSTAAGSTLSHSKSDLANVGPQKATPKHTQQQSHDDSEWGFPTTSASAGTSSDNATRTGNLTSSMSGMKIGSASKANTSTPPAATASSNKKAEIKAQAIPHDDTDDWDDFGGWADSDTTTTKRGTKSK